jgi:hypothetical protein
VVERSVRPCRVHHLRTGFVVVSRLGASIAGRALGLHHIVAALFFVVPGDAVSAAVAGAASLIVGTALLTSVIGVAAVAQPPIGNALLGDTSGVQDRNCWTLVIAAT